MCVRALTGKARDDGGRRRGRRSRGEETEIFVSVVYIGGAFSTGWSHQPVLKVKFGQAKRREEHTFSTRWWLELVLKTNPLVPVCATTRY